MEDNVDANGINADIYKYLISNINKNQEALYEIKSLNLSLNSAEDLLREKIKLRYQELTTLNKEYTCIMDTYTQIIKVTLKK